MRTIILLLMMLGCNPAPHKLGKIVITYDTGQDTLIVDRIVQKDFVTYVAMRNDTIIAEYETMKLYIKSIE